MIRPPVLPLLCITPATGRIVRYARRALSDVHGVGYALDVREVELPEESRTLLGDPGVWGAVESFRVRGAV